MYNHTFSQRSDTNFSYCRFLNAQNLNSSFKFRSIFQAEEELRAAKEIE
jgi:hypothetical protein